ncbi:MAG: FAD-dependent monooxygenase [Kofleriaceae bacterium]
MKIACIGGGPAGLYLGILVKRAAPEHEVVVFERNRPADTFGFGVVFSDATLGNLADADPDTHAQITAKFARWDDIEVHVGGEVLTSTGHGFCGLERKALLGILQSRARELGVRVDFECDVRSLDEARTRAAAALGGAPEIIVGCDGVGSWVRDSLAADLGPHVDVRPNKFVWLGCTVPYRAFTFIFKHTPHGLFRVHAYPFTAELSTFIVECREDTWRAAGLATADEDGTLAYLEGVFADELAGHRLIKNRSIWRNFPTVRCARWSTRTHTPTADSHVVLLGDAAHTAHFSIGSGTKLAMEDSIALRDELLSSRDASAALAAYEARRRPEVDALQAAAQASLEWFEGTERYMQMTPLELTYSLMTRSLRVSHRSMHKRDPHLARGMEELLASRAGIADIVAPTSLPYSLGDVRLRSRIALSASDDDLVRVARDAALVVTRALAPEDIDAPTWAPIAEGVHAAGAKLAMTLSTSGASTSAASTSAASTIPASNATERATDGSLLDAAKRAAALGADLLVLDPGRDNLAIELLPFVVETVRAVWPAGSWLAAVVHDIPRTRNAVVGHAAQLRRAGADLLWIDSPGDGSARLPAAPIADRLRNELHLPTCVDADDATLADLDAAIAAGRADLVVATKMPSATRSAS